MPTVVGIDPGPLESAYVVWDGTKVKEACNVPNITMLRFLSDGSFTHDVHCAIEHVRGFGVMASDSLFDTCIWSGRFLQAFGEHRCTWVPRKQVSAHLCGTAGISHDKFVREALITRFGGKDMAIGKKAAPGPLYGISGHLWAALAVAIVWHDNHVKSELRQ